MGDSAAPPQGLWADTVVEAASAPVLAGDVTTEVAVVGGGFCGLSAALHLAERGVKVTVLEAQSIGWGASGRNGGQVIAGLKLDPRELVAEFGEAQGQAMHRFAAATAELVYALIERFQIRCEAHRDGWIQAARSPQVLASIRARVADLQGRGENVEFLDAERVAALTGSRFYGGGMLDRRSGSVQPLAYANGLARAAAAQGALVLRQARVTGLARGEGGWRLATAAGPSVRAGRVLVAANAYLGGLFPALRAAMVPVESIQVATVPLPPGLDASVLPGRLPVSDLMDLGVYYRRDDGGRFVIGGAGALMGTAGPGAYRSLVRAARVLYPGLEPAHFVERWGGRLTLTRDHLPRLVSLEDGLLVAYGCNGRGVALMTALGKLAAQRLLDDPAADLPIATLPPARYPLFDLRLPAMLAVRHTRRLRRAFMRG